MLKNMDTFDRNIKTGKDIIELIKSAVRDNNVQAVEGLLEGFGDLSSLLNKVSEIWDLAVEYGRAEALEELLRNLEFKKNINVKNSWGLTPLMQAAELDNASAVRKLLAAGAEYEISSDFYFKKTALYFAIANGKTRALKVLIKNKRISPAMLVALLKFAVSRNNVNAVKVLLEAGIDITIQTAGDPYEWDGTVLHMAVSSDKIEILDLLLKHQDINQVLNLPSKKGYTPLMRAAFLGNADAVSKLIDAGADATIQVTKNLNRWNGTTALHMAAELNKIEVLGLLLKHKDIKNVLNLRGVNGFTPLMSAVFKGHEVAVGMLIDAGANESDKATALNIAASLDKIEGLESLLKHKDIKKILNFPNREGYTPLMRAAFEGNEDIVSKLIDAGADITIQITENPYGWDGYTALHIAVEMDKIKVLESLLKHNDIKQVLNLPGGGGFTPLMRAACKGNEGAVSKLINAGADITIQITENPYRWEGATALHMAVFYNKIEVLDLLLKNKDTKQILNLSDGEGYTPLMRAVWKGHADTVWMLIGAGADITIQINGVTALHIAADRNKIEVLELLLGHKDIKQILNLPKENGFTPLMGAAFKGHTDAVNKLIEAGSDIKIQVTGSLDRWNGATALHIAAEENKEVLELLLKHKDIKKVLNLLDGKGFTPLMRAVWKGHAGAVSKLIRAGADVTVQVTGNSNGWDGATALYIAASSNKIEVLELLLEHQDIREVLNLPDKDGYTPLMSAALRGHADAVSKLIDAGADVTIQVTGNSNGWDGATALYLAAHENKIEMLELLLKHKDIKQVLNLPSKRGYTPLMRAVWKGHADAVSKLIDAGADITIQINGATALHIAADRNKIEVLELLLKHKDIKQVLNLLDGEGYTPLMRAAFKGHADAVSKLIDAGADITIQVTGNLDRWNGATALHIAASLNKIKVLELLLKHKCIKKVLNLRDASGYTPLMSATWGGHTDVVNKLIHAGADITIQVTENRYGRMEETALHIAAELNRIEVLELLLRYQDIKQVLNLPGGEGFTPLMRAAFKGHTDAVNKLIEAGSDIKIQVTGSLDRWNGATVLHIAAEVNQIEVLELLLKHHRIWKVLNLRDGKGYTPLVGAAFQGHEDAVSKLIDAGADISIQITENPLCRWNGATTLHIAAYENKIEVLELLLKHKDIKQVLNLPNRDGYTPLMGAAFEGNEDIVRKLIQAGTDVTIQVTGNPDGWDGATALHIAARENKIEVLELLLNHKNIKKVLNLPNQKGYTPLMGAAFEGHEDAVSKLIEAGADITIEVIGNLKGQDGATALHIAAEMNKIEVLELLLKHNDIKQVLNLPNRDGFTPLMGAAFEGHADAVSKLIGAGADITIQITGNSDGWNGATTLHIAAYENKIEVLELLLKHKNIKQVLNLRDDENGYTPLMGAASKGHEDAVSKLIDAGADIIAQNREKNTATHLAAKYWKGESFGVLTVKAPEVSKISNVNGDIPVDLLYDEATALYTAAEENEIEMLKLVLKRQDIKQVLNLPWKNGFTPLMGSASKGHVDAVSKLIEAGADITAQIIGNSKGLDGVTALYIAASLNKIEVLELLLKHKDIKQVLNLPRQDGYTPLMGAASKGHVDAMSKLIGAGADITQVTSWAYGGGETALHIAAYENEIEVLELLLKHKDIEQALNLPNKDGLTPLIDAASKGHADAVSKLIDAGADITAQIAGNSKGWDGATALYIAASLNKIEVLELLLKHKDIREVLNLPKEDGYTPLIDAASKGHADAVSKLIDAGADITAQITGNSKGLDGLTALHIAVFYNKFYNKIEVLELLLKHQDMKKVLDLPDKNGCTPLICAAMVDHTDTVSRLIEAGADITIQVTGNSEWNGYTALYIAASLNKIEVLELLLKHKDIREVLNLPDKDGYTSLMDAASKGHADAVSKLIEAGADITAQITGNSKGWDGATALYIAAEINKIEVLELLLKHKDIREVLNLPDKNGHTPLMHAASKGHADAVSKLIEAGANITAQITGNSKGWDGSTALHIAVFYNKMEVLKLLLKHKDIKRVLNLPNKNGCTPLMDAARGGHADAVSKLIEAGADITAQITGNSKGWDGATALHIAVFYNKFYNKIEVLELLLKHQDMKKVLDLPDKNGCTPLICAAMVDHTDTVSRLIEAGADITIQVTGNSEWNGYTALYIAASLNKIEVLELLLKHKDIREVLNLPDKDGYTSLMDAASKGHADAVSKLIEAGADITAQITGNSKGWDGATALYIAAEINKIEVLELLLKHKDIREVLNLPDKNGYTPLMHAASKGHADAVSKLIEAGANITAQITGNSKGWDGSTALHIAVFYNKMEVLKLLLKHKDIKRVLNLPNKNGCTPLMDAARGGHADAVSKLIEAGADITAQITGNSKGWGGATALHIVVFYNKMEVLKLLLKHKDIKRVLNLPNKNGCTPLMDAARGGHADAVSKLIEAGADITAQITGNSKGWDGATALHIVATLNKIKILELLLNHKDIKKILNLPNQKGYTPLMCAAYRGHEDAVSKLIDAGADITIQITGNPDGWDGATALYLAARLNSIEALELLLKHKDIEQVLNLPNKDGLTPLMDAARGGHADAVSKLIEAGADITAQITGNPDGWGGATALYIAASLNKIEVLELLLKHMDIKQVLNLPGVNDFTPLMGAAFKGHEDAVSKLIDAGADITIQITENPDGWDGATALHIAAYENKIEVLELLLKHMDIKQVLNLPGVNDFTPLMGAAFKGHEDAVSKLIDAGADITIQITENPDGWDGATALHIAAYENKIEVLELLLKHMDIKQVLNLPGINGYTPLMGAVSRGHEDAVSKLIDAGAAAHFAAKYGQEKSSEVLIAKAKAPEVSTTLNETGHTPGDSLNSRQKSLSSEVGIFSDAVKEDGKQKKVSYSK